MKFFALVFLLCSVAFPQTYVRSEWGGTWIDADKDCQNTRQEVLIDESLIPVSFDETGCRVTSGLWVCIYTGQVFTDPTLLDIDHLVPLENAFYAGGYLWTGTNKKIYANFLSDKYHLVAVSKAANRSKQGRSPDQWMPPYEPSRCAYLKMWTDVKERWDLVMTVAEEIFIEDYSNEHCD
jgi:hypothetical protein